MAVAERLHRCVPFDDRRLESLNSSAYEQQRSASCLVPKPCRFASWVSKHGHLLKVLQLGLNLSGKERVDGEALIAGALQRANGVSSMGLQLQTYRSYPACAGTQETRKFSSCTAVCAARW